MYFDGKSPVRLTAEEEKDLARRRDAGDVEARNLLVERNIPLALKAVAPYQREWAAFADDLVGEAMLGLIRAADGFDPGAGCRFSTYAIPWVRQKVNRWLADHSRLVRVPAYLQTETAGRKRSKFAGAADLAMAASCRSLSGPSGDLPDPAPADPIVAAETSAILDEEIGRLGDRDGAILRRRYGFDGEPEEQIAIARSLGISKQWIVKRHQASLHKLAAKLEARGISA